MYILGSPLAFLCLGMVRWCLPRSLAPVAWPIAKLLDHVLGVHSAHTYKKAELKSFLQFHRTGEEPLRDDEISILNGVLELNTKNVEQIMTPIEVCYHCTLPVEGKSNWCCRMLFHLARILSWIQRLSISCKFPVAFMLFLFNNGPLPACQVATPVSRFTNQGNRSVILDYYWSRRWFVQFIVCLTYTKIKLANTKRVFSPV